MKPNFLMSVPKKSTNVSIILWVLFAIFLGSVYTLYPTQVKLFVREEQSPQSGYNGVVASENAICSQIGVDILKKGGYAVDSVIATGICIGTTNMHSSGIGGGGFLVVRTKDEQTSFNFREKAPSASFTDMYRHDPSKAQVGGLAVGVPGELKGYYEAYKKFGKLPWRDLIQPSIDLSRRGWIITSHFAKRIGLYAKEIENHPIMGRVLAPNGTILKAGDWMNRPVYARTLESIANDGIDVFYNGWIARELVKTVQDLGGILTMEDLAEYNVEVEVPLRGTYRGMDIITAPPPAR
jgi:gamma-glutamyltranspeptidase/glutathione hydrolase/leukotriene-C4 hydrolase